MTFVLALKVLGLWAATSFAAAGVLWLCRRPGR